MASNGAQTPRCTRFLAEISCDPILEVLDRFLIEVSAEKDVRLTVVAYPGIESPPGDVLQHLYFVRSYLAYKRGQREDSIAVAIGPPEEKLAIEVFTSDPSTRIVPVVERYDHLEGLYDAGTVNTVRVDGEWHLGASICSLENIDVDGFASVLEAQPESRGRIVVHPTSGRPRSEAIKALAGIRNEILRSKERLRNRLTFDLGKRDKYPDAELWIIPHRVGGPRAKRSRTTPPN